jgi:DNA-binding GntR family transcriptional regulator
MTILEPHPRNLAEATAWSRAFDRPPYRTSRIISALRDAIARGEFAPGERLVEMRIAAQFGSSRGPVREALRELKHEGLVQLTPYRSAVVVGVSDEEVHNVLIPIRLTLERYGFVRALSRLGEDERASLRTVISFMEAAADAGHLGALVDADVRFHELVLEISDLPHTVQIWRSISPRIRSYLFRYDLTRKLDSVVQEHRDLYAALLADDESEMLALLDIHIAVPRPVARSRQTAGGDEGR